MSVLLLCPDSAGGIGRHVRMLADGLVERGFPVTVCAPAATVERFDFAAGGAAAVSLPVGDRAGWRTARRRLRELAAGHDVVHAHGVRAGALAAAAGAWPLVTTWHNAPLGSGLRRVLHRRLEVFTAKRSALVLGASPDLVERARSAGAPRTRLCEVAAPVLSPLARPTGPALHQPPVVLAVGRLHPQKRFDLLIDAVAHWPGAPVPQVLIAGDGPLAQSLERRAERSGASVRLLGRRADVAALLAEADVVVISSDWEARPLVAQEALCAGLPLVATDVGGISGLVGDAAVLVPPGDAQALAAGLRRVLDDGALRTRLRAAGPAQAATWPTVDEMVDRLWRDYLEVKSRSKHSRGGPRRDTPTSREDNGHND